MIIGVWNNAGGQGKTTISTALAYGFLAKFGRGNVLLIDSDSQSNVTDNLKVKATYRCDLLSLLTVQKGNIRPNHTEWGFDLITGDYHMKDIGGKLKEDVLIQNIGNLFRILNEMYAVTIVDCSPSLEGNTLKTILSCIDRFVIPMCMVGRKELAGVRSSFRFLSELKIDHNTAYVLRNMHGAEYSMLPKVRKMLNEMGHNTFNTEIPDCPLYLLNCQEHGVPPGTGYRVGKCADFITAMCHLIPEILDYWKVKIPEMKYVGGDWDR